PPRHTHPPAAHRPHRHTHSHHRRIRIRSRTPQPARDQPATTRRRLDPANPARRGHRPLHPPPAPQGPAHRLGHRHDHQHRHDRARRILPRHIHRTRTPPHRLLHRARRTHPQPHRDSGTD